jgi:hypothetical protein
MRRKPLPRERTTIKMENLMLKDIIKDLMRDQLITAKDLDVMERETSSYASKLFDQISWELEASEKSKLIAELNQVNQNLQVIYAARADIYATN